MRSGRAPVDHSRSNESEQLHRESMAYRNHRRNRTSNRQAVGVTGRSKQALSQALCDSQVLRIVVADSTAESHIPPEDWPERIIPFGSQYGAAICVPFRGARQDALDCSPFGRSLASVDRECAAAPPRGVADRRSDRVSPRSRLSSSSSAFSSASRWHSTAPSRCSGNQVDSNEPFQRSCRTSSSSAADARC